jgi:uncharacterized protein (TIGR00252 family)
MPASPDRKTLGAAAEAAACAHLEAAGLHRLAHHVNYRFGELDWVMREGDTIVFVEVRYRRDESFGGAAGSVDFRKRRRLVLAAKTPSTASGSAAPSRSRTSEAVAPHTVSRGGGTGRRRCSSRRRWRRASSSSDAGR